MHTIRAQQCRLWNDAHFTQHTWVLPDNRLKLMMKPFLQRELEAITQNTENIEEHIDFH